MNIQTHTKSITLFLLGVFLVGTTCPVSARKRKGIHNGPNVSINIQNKKKRPPLTYFNLGLLSNYKQLDGFSLNAISNVVHYESNGFQTSGLLNVAGLRSSGVHIAGLANLAGRKAYGLRIAGLTNISGKSSYGMHVAGLANVTGENQRGFILSGLFNMSSCDCSGFHVSGLANIAGDHLQGAAFSGLMNVAGKDMAGFQLTALMNVVGRDNKGFQLAGVSNVSVNNKGLQLSGLANYTENNEGMQISIANVSNHCNKGSQIGIVNICGDDHARQLGIVNLKPSTKVQMIISGGSANRFNASARFVNRYVYTQLGAGLNYGDFTDKISLSGFYRAGLIYPLLPNKLDISGDLGFYHIETLNNKKEGCPARLYALQPRISLEYHPVKKFGIFVSGGYGWTRTYKGNHSYDNKPVVEAGIILF